MIEEVEYEDGTSKIEALSKRARGRKLMDQKANSVADMAAVLSEIDPLRAEGKEKVAGEGEDGAKEVVVEVRWKDLLDAEFASTWPENVLHHHLDGGGMESVYGDAVQAAEEARMAKEKEAAAAAEKKPEQQVTM